MNEKRFAVAIDGPSGSGKSTAAKKTAAALNMVYVDTGAMYRSIALYVLRQRVQPADQPAVERLLDEIKIHIRPSANGQRLLLNDEDVTEALRTQEIAEGASVIAAYRCVREKLADLQRAVAEQTAVVMDGRDIGSQILPWAQVKIYMDASPDARVERRLWELRAQNLPCDPEVVRREIQIRDERDLNREFAPLIRAADALYLDTSGMDAEEAAHRVIEIVKKRRA